MKPILVELLFEFIPRCKQRGIQIKISNRKPFKSEAVCFNPLSRQSIPESLSLVQVRTAFAAWRGGCIAGSFKSS